MQLSCLLGAICPFGELFVGGVESCVILNDQVLSWTRYFKVEDAVNASKEQG